MQAHCFDDTVKNFPALYSRRVLFFCVPTRHFVTLFFVRAIDLFDILMCLICLDIASRGISHYAAARVSFIATVTRYSIFYCDKANFEKLCLIAIVTISLAKDFASAPLSLSFEVQEPHSGTSPFRDERNDSRLRKRIFHAR